MATVSYFPAPLASTHSTDARLHDLRLLVTLPANAVTGLLAVETPHGNTTAASEFSVIPLPSPNPVVQIHPIDPVVSHKEHGPYVAQMFLRSCFAKILQPPNNDVFRWGEPDSQTLNHILSEIAECPRMEFVPVLGVEFALPSRRHENDSVTSAQAVD